MAVLVDTLKTTRARHCWCTTLLIVAAAGVGPVLRASSNLVGTAAIEHCGNADRLTINCSEDEAVQLRFSSPHDTLVLSIDFVLRGRNVPKENPVVEVFLSLPQRPASEPSRVVLQMNHRTYPLAFNVDGQGVAQSIVPLEDFVNLAMTSPVEGTAFGKHFVATNEQMLTLRLALGRWAADISRRR